MSTIAQVKSGLCLRVLEGSHQEPMHPLSRSVISVGRTTAESPYSSSYITFPEATVSRLHMVLTWEPGASTYMVHHRSQTNPTLLNGRQLTRSELLKPGDILSLGRLVLLVEAAKGQPMDAPSPRETSQLTLNVQSSSEAKARVFSIPVQKEQLSVSFTPERRAAAIAAEETGELSQVIALPAAQKSELSFQFQIQDQRALVETPEAPCPTTRETPLPFGTLAVPLRVGTPLEFSKADVMRHQGYQIWLSDGGPSRPPGDTTEGASEPKAPSQGSNEDSHNVLHFRNGAWKGATLTTPSQGPLTFTLGPRTTSFHHPLPLPNMPTCQITVQDGQAQLRVCELSDDKFIDVNGELLYTGESTNLFSGSSLLLGESEFFWVVPSLHSAYSKFQILEKNDRYNITKAQVRLGTAAHCEIRFKSQALAPVVGFLEYTGSGFLYRHHNIALPARIDGVETSAGLEVPIRVGSILELAPGVRVSLGEREPGSC